MTDVLRDDGVWVDDAAGSAAPALDGFLVDAAAQSVRLAPTDDASALAPHVGRLRLVAIEFPIFSDGRGYSIATLLRRRHGYEGEMLAVGDVLIDQLFMLRRVGFTRFAVRADQDRDRAVRALSTYSDVYQGAFDEPLPAYRRRVRPTATERAA